MRGGPRLMCSPYLTGSLAVMLILVTFNYWSVSTQNSDLVLEVQQMTRQMKLSSERVEKLESSLSECRGDGQRSKGARDNLEAKALRLQEEKKQAEDREETVKKKLQNRVEKFEKDVASLETDKREAETEKDKLKKELMTVRANSTSCSLQVSDLKNSSWRLANCLAELANERAEKLVNPIGIGGIPMNGNKSSSLGEGQLPDVNIDAVEVVKKDTLGHNGMFLEPEGEKYPGNIVDRRGSSKSPPVMAVPIVARGISSTSSVVPPLGKPSPASPLLDKAGAGVAPPIAQSVNLDRAEDDSVVPEQQQGEEDQSPDGEIDETVDVEKQHYLVDKANEVADGGEVVSKDAAVEISGENNDNLDNLKKSLNEKDDAEEEKEET